jgi:hypothetical protein
VSAQSAEQYLDAALEVIGSRALFASRIDWALVKSEARSRARDARVPSETYEAIRFALESLGDGHSFLLDADSAGRWRTDEELVGSMPLLEVRDFVSVLTIPPLVSGNEGVCRSYATHLHELIDSGSSARAWIVDLRGNSGGNMWPMLCGLGPLLGEGLLGRFRLASNTMIDWVYREGRALLDGREIVRVERPVATIPETPVAVLIASRTGSSGEAIAVAFRGSQTATFFGEPSAGYSTCNEDIELSDGARMFLCTGVFVDRQGVEYPNGLVPDVPCEAATTVEVALEFVISEAKRGVLDA